MTPHQQLSTAFDLALAFGVESLSRDQHDLYLIQDFIIEFEMGGLTGYFYNRLPLKNHISATISALRKYQLGNLAELLTEAALLFGPNAITEVTNTWEEVRRHNDLASRLTLIENQIATLDDYGLSRSRIE